MTNATYYVVTADNTWSNQPITIEQASARGFQVLPSRRSGDFQLFRDSNMVGWMFATQAEQIAFLRSRGAL